MNSSCLIILKIHSSAAPLKSILYYKRVRKSETSEGAAGREDTSSACCPLSLRAVYVLAFISLMETGVWDGINRAQACLSALWGNAQATWQLC